VDKVLDSEIKRAREEGSKLVLTNETGAGGRNKLVVTIDANAQGDFTNDWLKNKTITESDNRRIYRFDAETKLLEALKIYIYPEKGKEVLVLEIKDIEYNIDIDYS
jgi:nitrate reductase NapAB chaperone NapD